MKKKGKTRNHREWWHTAVHFATCTLPGAQDLNESHELRVLNCNCHQTKSSPSLRKKGVFWGTLEWILLPRRETNWARQASLREWLKLVCGSASAPSNKEKKPQRESEREIAWETGVAVLVEEGEDDSEGKMRAKEGGLTMAHYCCKRSRGSF